MLFTRAGKLAFTTLESDDYSWTIFRHLLVSPLCLTNLVIIASGFRRAHDSFF